MIWNAWVRQAHRWTSIIFTLVVGALFALFALFALLGLGREPAQWAYLLPLLPLALLLVTGLYLFALPHAARWRAGRRAAAWE